MKSIVLLVLVLLIGGGVFFWYSSNEKAMKIEQYQKKIEELKVQREKIPERLSWVNKEHDNLKQEISGKTSSIEEKQAKL